MVELFFSWVRWTAPLVRLSLREESCDSEVKQAASRCTRRIQTRDTGTVDSIRDGCRTAQQFGIISQHSDTGIAEWALQATPFACPMIVIARQEF